MNDVLTALIAGKVGGGAGSGGSGGGKLYIPVASPTVLGGVMPVEATQDMTQPVGVDANGGLFTADSGGCDGWTLVTDMTVEETVASVDITLPEGTKEVYAVASLGYCDSEGTQSAGRLLMYIMSSQWRVVLQSHATARLANRVYARYIAGHVFMARSASTDKVYGTPGLVGTSSTGTDSAGNDDTLTVEYLPGVSFSAYDGYIMAGSQIKVYAR